MKSSNILILVCSAICSFAASGSSESLYDYLFTKSDDLLSHSKSIAQKEKDRITTLLKETDGLVLFLPTDRAWDMNRHVLKKIAGENESDLRYDLLLASSADIPITAATSFSELENHAAQSGGIIDSAYGTSYFVRDQHICIAEWHGGRYVEGQCAKIIGEPVRLSDAIIFVIDELLLPPDLLTTS